MTMSFGYYGESGDILYGPEGPRCEIRAASAEYIQSIRCRLPRQLPEEV